MLVSRLAQFEPGYLYGVICGVAFATKLTTTQKGHIVALCALTTLSIAVIAWLLWLPVTGIAQQPGAFAGVVILDDLLASIFVSGLVGSAIGLLPLRFLPGWDLRQWHQGVWLGCFGLAMFGVVEVLLIPHNDNHSNVPLITTLVLMVVFGGISVGLRELFARRLRRRSGRQAPATFRDHVRELLNSGRQRTVRRASGLIDPPAAELVRSPASPLLSSVALQQNACRATMTPLPRRGTR